MKKKLFLLPLFALALSSCDLTSIFKKEPDNNGQNSGQKEEESGNEEGGGGQEEGGGGEEETVVNVTSISLNKTEISLYEGETQTLSYTVLPTNATNKEVSWLSSYEKIASVENGVIKALSAGSCIISVTTKDGNKEAYCSVTVLKHEEEKQYIKDEFVLDEQGYTFDNKSLVNSPIEFNGYKITFAVGDNTYNNQPSIIKKDKHYDARIYWGNTFTVTSATNTIKKIEFTKSANDKGNSLSCSNGEFVDGVWVGETKDVTFSVVGTSGYVAYSAFAFFYEGQSSDDPEKVINLGEKTIAEVKEYIAKNPIKVNSHQCGVNENRYVTITGLALAKIDLIKYTAAYGLDVSEHGKVILGDATGVIGCATVVNNLGTSLWGKVAKNQCKNTSTYKVTGYLSTYLGNPEILVTAFEWDSSLDVKIDYSKIVSETSTLTDFYNKAKAVNYNCAGHGYGEVLTLENLKCTYMEPDGQGIRYYNFTDGTKNIRVNAYNVGSATVGNVYNVTGIISLKNLSPIIIAFEIKTVPDKTVDFDYKSVAQNITISGLKAIHGSQDDTDTRYDNVVECYGNYYKTTGYMVAVEEGGKLYVGISDSPREEVITGKTNAMTTYNVVLIKNDNFWNTTEDELYLFNPIYDEYLLEDKPIDVYYVTRQLEYSNKKPMWEILLLPEFLADITPAE